MNHIWYFMLVLNSLVISTIKYLNKKVIFLRGKKQCCCHQIKGYYTELKA